MGLFFRGGRRSVSLGEPAGFPASGRQFGDAGLGVRGGAAQHVGEVFVRIDAEAGAAFDQRGAVSTGNAAGEEPVLPTHPLTSQSPRQNNVCPALTRLYSVQLHD